MEPLHWDEFIFGRYRALGRQYLPYLLKALLVYVLVWGCLIIVIGLAMQAPHESVISALKTLVIYAFFVRLFIELLPRSVDVTKNRVRIKHVTDVTLSFEDLSDSLLSPLSSNLMRWEITWCTKRGRIRKVVLAVPLEKARLLETLPALSAQRHEG